MRIIKLLIVFVITASLSSCSEESLDENEVSQEIVVCELDIDDGCIIAYLEGEKINWIKISSAADLEDPYFLYLEGEETEPLGTVTFSMNVKKPVVRINDSEIEDIVVEISQNFDGREGKRIAEEDIILPTSNQDPDTHIKFTEDFVYPFYVKIKANIC